MATNSRLNDLREMYFVRRQYETELKAAYDAEEERRLSHILQQVRACIRELEDRS